MDLLQLPDDRAYDDGELVALLALKIAELLDTQRDWLLGKLYRLDVRERDIKAALAQPDVEVPQALAWLVVARHRECQASKRAHQSPGFDASDTEAGDMSW